MSASPSHLSVANRRWPPELSTNRTIVDQLERTLIAERSDSQFWALDFVVDFGGQGDGASNVNSGDQFNQSLDNHLDQVTQPSRTMGFGSHAKQLPGFVAPLLNLSHEGEDLRRS